MAEIGRDHVVYEKPSATVEPGHRNEEYENYQVFHLFLRLFEEIDGFRRGNYPDEVR